MSTREIIEADLTWTGEQFQRGVRVAIEQGRIVEVGTPAGATTRQLAGRALMPGMINVHSHAFQRGLRGRGETFPHGKGSFWTWREAMYALVDSLDAKTIHDLSVQAFREMLAAGVTTVGEFHYVRHDASLQGFALDEVVLDAARVAGIRIAMILSYYNTGGIRQPLKGGQLRFRTHSPSEYWTQFDRLAKVIEPATQSLAASAHSIRAASIEDIASLHEESIRRGLPFHMHVEEQLQEIADCVEAYGKPPMALINQRLAINPMFTAVHCTHTAGADMEEFLEHGGNVCINPLTEGNLGDGIPNVSRILKSQGRIALGSDSNNRLCWTEEMRWLEYIQRLATKSRGLVADDRGRVGNKLFEAATINGARGLGLRAGRIASGHVADFLTLDLEAASLRGWTDESLLDSFIFGCGNEVIASACVNGVWTELR